jgi:hypothetical protein
MVEIEGKWDFLSSRTANLVTVLTPMLVHWHEQEEDGLLYPKPAEFLKGSEKLTCSECGEEAPDHTVTQARVIDAIIYDKNLKHGSAYRHINDMGHKN